MPLPRDENRITPLAGVSSSDPNQVLPLKVNPTTGRLLIDVSGGSAPVGAAYIVLSADATLTNERVITAGTNISLTDGGAGGNLTISVVDSPTFAGSIGFSADNTYDLGSSTNMVRDVYTNNVVLANGKYLKWKDSGGVIQKIMWIDSANVLRIKNAAGGITYISPDVDSNVIFHINAPNAPTNKVVLDTIYADGTNTLRNSSMLTMRSKYWDSGVSASKSYDLAIQHILDSNTPTGHLAIINDAGSEILQIHDSGAISLYDYIDFQATTAPANPSADNIREYVLASGTSPNREIKKVVKFENGEEVIIASTLV